MTITWPNELLAEMKADNNPTLTIYKNIMDKSLDCRLVEQKQIFNPWFFVVQGKLYAK